MHTPSTPATKKDGFTQVDVDLFVMRARDAGCSCRAYRVHFVGGGMAMEHLTPDCPIYNALHRRAVARFN